MGGTVTIEMCAFIVRIRMYDIEYYVAEYCNHIGQIESTDYGSYAALPAACRAIYDLNSIVYTYHAILS